MTRLTPRHYPLTKRRRLMTTEEQSLSLLAAILGNQMALMMGLAELMDGMTPWAKGARTTQLALRLHHEQTRQLIEILKP
jgi:hypothetical protein